MNLKKIIAGFTLVEVLVAISITSIFATVITGVFLSAKNAFISNSAVLEVHAETRLAMDWILRDVKWANQTIPSVTIGGDDYSTGADELILNIPAIDGSGDILVGFFDTVVYALENTDLVRIISPDASSSRLSGKAIIANNVQNVNFVVNTNNIEVSITSQITVLNTRVLSDTLITTVTFRND